MRPISNALLFTAFFFITGGAIGQDKTKNKFGKGITIAAQDSSFSMKFSTRIQTLYEGQYNTATGDYSDRMQIRRARLKFDGFVYDPSFEYKIELAVANSDITSGSIPQSGNTANFVLDAVVKWNFYKRWSVWFGQTKLPGNRERVISSQNLQFVDRSLVNARFNLDRDAGLQFHYNAPRINLVGAVSMGEGRNMIVENVGGYNYTLRGEYLPFGQFKKKGDYISADLEREETPKLSVGVTYDFNDEASRERGQLGDFLNVQRDLSTLFIDSHFKYRGFSSLIEYAHRETPDGPVILNEGGDIESVFYTGRGISIQGGYLFESNFEIAARFTDIDPEEITRRNDHTQYTLGVSRYFVNHSLKIQSDVSLTQEAGEADTWMYRFQVEVAF